MNFIKVFILLPEKNSIFLTELNKKNWIRKKCPIMGMFTKVTQYPLQYRVTKRALFNDNVCIFNDKQITSDQITITMTVWSQQWKYILRSRLGRYIIWLSKKHLLQIVLNLLILCDCVVASKLFFKMKSKKQ